MKKVTIKGIKWDTDGENQDKLGLPQDGTVYVPNDFDVDEDIDEIVDALSDDYGYCIHGFKGVEVTNEIDD